MDIRLILDPPASGAWNMAVDEALLESAERAGQGGCLRFYYWDQATVSLGYFQRGGDRHGHAPSHTCPLVRRSTGGGAIVHDRELTYSFTSATRSHQAADRQALFTAFHQTLVEEFASRGITARLHQRATSPRTLDDSDRLTPGRSPGVVGEPFLCFQRRAEGDVLLRQWKVGGSAQRRQRGALLQHGSVLLDRSPNAPELDGIRQISGIELDPHELARRWSQRVAASLGVSLRTGQLTEEEIARAEGWSRDRFDSPAWNQRR
jgi:lipoate-protein ligase A